MFSYPKLQFSPQHIQKGKKVINFKVWYHILEFFKYVSTLFTSKILPFWETIKLVGTFEKRKSLRQPELQSLTILILQMNKILFINYNEKFYGKTK